MATRYLDYHRAKHIKRQKMNPFCFYCVAEEILEKVGIPPVLDKIEEIVNILESYSGMQSPDSDKRKHETKTTID